MEFLSLLQADEWQSGLTVVLGISLILLGPYILAGLSTAVKMLKGRLKTEIISGRPGPFGKLAWFAVSKYGCEYKKVMMEIDGLDQPVIFKKLRVGPKLKQHKAFHPGDRYIMLVRKKKKGSFNKVDLLAISNGREVFISPTDIFTLYDLDRAQIFILAVLGFLVGLRFPAPLLAGWGPDLGPLIAVLVSGLLPATALFILYRQAADKFIFQAQERLEEFARTWDPEGGVHPVWAKVLSLPVDKDHTWLGVFGGLSFLVQPLGFVLTFVLASATMLNNLVAAFTMPGFELRTMKLESFDDIRKDSSDRIYLKNVVMRDLSSGIPKTIKKLFPAPNQLHKWLMSPGLSGVWLIRAGDLADPSTPETRRSLTLIGYTENAQDVAEVLSPASIASGYTGPLHMVPLQAGLIGMAALVSATLILTGSWPSPAAYLWLIPWAALSTFLKFMARQRISAALAECLQSSPACNNHPILPGMVNRGSHDPQTF